MTLTRKVRRQGKSLIVAIPAQVAAMLELRAGGVVEIEILARDAIRVAKARA